MSLALVLPVLIPLVTAAATMLTLRWLVVQRWLGVVGAGLYLVAAVALARRVAVGGVVAGQAGAWPAPFGITLVADHLSVLMVLVTAVVGVATAVYSLDDIDAERERFGYYPLLHVLLAGVTGAFLTGDIFNLYVWFEVMLAASFVLLALGGERAQLVGAVRYVALNLVSSLFFLAAAGVLYALAGTLNLADLAVRLAATERPGLVTTVGMLFMVAFGIKAAVFPLFLWLPVSYHTPPVAVSAIFAGLLTKVGVYALLRVFTLLFTHDIGYTHGILLWVAGLTMISGVIGAAAQSEVRRILAFHVVSQIGYMIMGLALFTPLALAGAIFYIVHHIVVKTNLFLVGGVLRRAEGSFELDRMGGAWQAHPWISVLFLIPAFSLAGIPPLSGFWAKLILARAGLEAGAYVIVGTALLVGLVTLFSMTKIWAEAFWKPRGRPAATTRAGSTEASASEASATEAGRTGTIHTESAQTGTARPGAAHAQAAGAALGGGAAASPRLLIPIAGLAAVTLTIGLWAEPLLTLSERAAVELLDPEAYIHAVLGVLP